MDFNLNSTLIFDMPTQKDLLMIQSLSEDPFYCYVFKEVKDFEKLDPIRYFQYVIRQTDHAFVGYIQGYYPQNPQDLWIQKLLIHKDYLHKGYGTRIINNLIQRLTNSAFYTHIYLTCHKNNQIGNLFWHRMGFQKIKDNIHDTHLLYCYYLRS